MRRSRINEPQFFTSKSIQNFERIIFDEQHFKELHCNNFWTQHIYKNGLNNYVWAHSISQNGILDEQHFKELHCKNFWTQDIHKNGFNNFVCANSISQHGILDEQHFKELQYQNYWTNNIYKNGFNNYVWAQSNLKPWSSGYGWRLMFVMLWVRMLVPNTGWTFFTLICCKNCIDVCLKRPKKRKRGRGWLFF